MISSCYQMPPPITFSASWGPSTLHRTHCQKYLSFSRYDCSISYLFDFKLKSYIIHFYPISYLFDFKLKSYIIDFYPMAFQAEVVLSLHVCQSVLSVNFTLSTRKLVTDLSWDHQICTKHISWYTLGCHWKWGSLPWTPRSFWPFCLWIIGNLAFPWNNL